jgi:hypothetical protein
MSRAVDVMSLWVELRLYVTAGLQRANAEPDNIWETVRPET